MKKVLIISYYWPPSGGSGVQRWLKFVKYLPSMGIEPHVLIPDGAQYPDSDPSLLKDIPAEAHIYRVPIIEPYSIFSFLTGTDPKTATRASFIQNMEKKDWKSRLSFWIRSNLFIPDARMLWIGPAAKAALKIMKKEQIDVLISTGPPHSCHLAALKVKQKIKNIHWLADFRDPWTGIDYFKDLNLTALARERHHQLEKKVVQTADRVIVIGETMGKEFSELGAKRVEVIHNGFDTEDIAAESPKVEPYTITYAGTMGKSRNPDTLWSALDQIFEANPDTAKKWRIRLIGRIDPLVRTSLENKKWKEQVEWMDYMDHERLQSYLMASDILLVVVNQAPNAKGILTGKIFEYLASGRPVLALGPEDGDLASILHDISNAQIFKHGNTTDLTKWLENYTTMETGIDPNAMQYSRKELTKKLSNCIK